MFQTEKNTDSNPGDDETNKISGKMQGLRTLVIILYKESTIYALEINVNV